MKLLPNNNTNTLDIFLLVAEHNVINMVNRIKKSTSMVAWLVYGDHLGVHLLCTLIPYL